MLIAIVAEDDAHTRVARRLTDRRLCERVTWLADHDDLAPFRQWLPADRWFTRSQLAGGATPRHLHGAFPGDPAALFAAKVFFGLEGLPQKPAAVIFCHDGDRAAREDGYRSARQGIPGKRGVRAWSFRIVLMVPNPEVEAWFIVLAGAAGAVPQAWRDDMRATLGFDPCREPTRMTSTSGDRNRDVKVIWSALERSVPNAEQIALEAPWAAVDAVPDECGLRAFIADVDGELVPLAGGPPG
ncbi:MAG: hypothetical protein HY904_23570 [Deltaproteobacteria bacterium]|nr:hypothetical protein [Deltaproteobacteria bacterium]